MANKNQYLNSKLKKLEEELESKVEEMNSKHMKEVKAIY